MYHKYTSHIITELKIFSYLFCRLITTHRQLRIPAHNEKGPPQRAICIGKKMPTHKAG